MQPWSSHARSSCVLSGLPKDKQGYNGAVMRHLCILHSSRAYNLQNWWGGWLIAARMINGPTNADKISAAICNVRNTHTATHTHVVAVVGCVSLRMLGPFKEPSGTSGTTLGRKTVNLDYLFHISRHENASINNIISLREEPIGPSAPLICSTCEKRS